MSNTVLNTKVIETLNLGTGEIVESVKTKTYRVSREPSYVKTYLDDRAILYKLSPKALGFTMALIDIMDYEGNVYLNPTKKKQLAGESGYSRRGIDTALTTLTKLKICINVDLGTYAVNPYLFSKGSWSEVSILRDRWDKLKPRVSNLHIYHSNKS